LSVSLTAMVFVAGGCLSRFVPDDSDGGATSDGGAIDDAGANLPDGDGNVREPTGAGALVNEDFPAGLLLPYPGKVPMRRIHDRKTAESRFISRRQFLLGAGGEALTLPPLLSLMSRKAAAASAGPVKRVVCFPISIMKAVGLQPAEYLSVGGAGNPGGFGDFDGSGTSDYLAYASTHNSPLPFINV
jgi:hypothetical protein